MKSPSVSELRQLGFTVRVTHYRSVPSWNNGEPSLYPEYLGYYRDQYKSNGGMTEVLIFLPSDGETTPLREYWCDILRQTGQYGPVLFGTAHCGLKDLFCRKAGVQLAICRAFGIDPAVIENLHPILKKNMK